MSQLVLWNCILNFFILGIGPAAAGSAPNAAIFFCTYDREQINQSINYSIENQSVKTKLGRNQWKSGLKKSTNKKLFFSLNHKLIFDLKKNLFS